MIRKVWKFFCSVKLTVVLFVLILIPSIIGTIILQNAPNPSQYVAVYGPTWDRIFRFLGFYDVYHDMRFVILLVLLGLNTLACTINRVKLRWNRAGSMMTHFGLLFILLGGLIGAAFGVKGFMIINEGEATDTMTIGRATQREKTLPFKVKLVDFILDTRETPANKLFVMNVNTGRQEGYTIQQGETVTLPRSRWANLLAMADVKPKGDTLAVEEVLPHAFTATSITEGPEKTGMAAMEFKITGDGVEKQAYVISQIERPYVFTKGNLAVGYLAVLDSARLETRLNEILAQSEAGDQLEIVLPGKSEKKIYSAKVGSKHDVESTGYSVEVLRYVPDFVITPEREVVSRSDQPNNPAIQVRITGPDGASQDQWLFAKFPTMHSTADMPLQIKFKMNAQSSGSSLRLFVLNPADAEPVVAIMRGGKLLEKETVDIGRPVNVPDAPYSFTVERFLKDANIIRKIVNRADMSNQPAIKVALDGSSEPYYLWEGTPIDVPGYKMVFQQEDIIKDFYSILQIINNGHVAAEKKIEVNDPLRYGGYTFYQASYDSEHSRWTGLQVKKDPGVALVYLGFTVMILGMIVIFYINPLLRRARRS